MPTSRYILKQIPRTFKSYSLVKTKSRFKIVEVNWVDSEHHADWEKISDVIEEQSGSLGCRSVGYLISDTEDRIILATSVSEDEETEEQVSAYITIPKICITSQKELRKR